MFMCNCGHSDVTLKLSSAYEIILLFDSRILFKEVEV